MTSKLPPLLLAPALLAAALGLHAQELKNSITRFEISRFEVEGNTLLARPDLEQVLTPFKGKDRSFGDVQQALKALQFAYRERGYSVVQVALPEQELNGGVVRIRIIEIRLGKVTVEGNRFFDEANLRRSLPGLRAGETPDLPAISRSLKVANENPAKKIVLQLQGAERKDEVDAVLKVKDEKPWSAGLSIDNTGDDNTGRNRLSVLLQHANVGGLDHVASLQYTTSLSDPSRVSAYGVGYHVPLYALGDSLDFFGSYSDVDSGTVSAGLFNLQVSGKGSVFGARYNRHFDRIGDYESKLIGGVDYKAFKSSVSMLGIQLGNEITVRPLSLTYTGNWAANNQDAGFYLSGSTNIPGGENGTTADFNRVRTGASANYTVWRYGGSYRRILPRDWQIRVGLNGQSTRDALVPGEQFGAGGNATVRGFHEREIASDSGQVANLEIYTPNLCEKIQAGVQCRLLGFYDTAAVSRNNPLPGEQTHASIASAGFGMRMSIHKNFGLQMDLGRVIDAADTRAKGEQRLHFKMALSY